MDFSKVKTIYMIGIKGVGMTMLAEFLAHQGYSVSGSDTGETFMTDAVLEKAGITIHQGFSADHLTTPFDVIIYSTAYNQETNEEVRAAFNQRLPVITFAEALGEIFNTHKGVAVCGSHGKTTTTAWLGYVAWQAGIKPNVMVGARVPQFDGASLVGDSNLLIIEADEYQNKLQYFKPKMIILNNIDYDHPDFFPDMAAYEKVFVDFVATLPKSGVLIANADDEQVQKVAQHCTGSVVTYSCGKEADYIASDIVYQNGQQFFKVSLGKSENNEGEITELGTFSISLLGRHNISNALAIIAASTELGLDLLTIRRYLGEFTGTARRFEIVGHYNQALIIDDYAHHPTEIKATLAAVRQRYQEKTIRVVFHPHTYTRTKALLADFARSFNEVDEVIVLEIYGSAREEQGGINGEEVANAIKQEISKPVIFIPTLTAVEDYLRTTIKPDEVIILMGAGDVFRIGERLLTT